MARVRALIRRRLRRVPPHEEYFLNIYPMMDMMTILLVFMVMQFAAAAAHVESADLELPQSISIVEPERALQVQVTRNEIVVDGAHVLDLRNGVVDPSQKQGGGTGFLITPLLEVLQQHRDRLRLIQRHRANQPFVGEVQIMADKRTPFRTLSEVLYTLGQSEFRHLRFVVLRREG